MYFIPNLLKTIKKFIVMTVAETFYENKSYEPISNKELQDLLKQYPDDAMVVVEYCNIMDMTYYPDRNLITID